METRPTRTSTASLLSHLHPLPRSSASPQLQTFYRLKGVQCWDSLVVDEIIVLLGRIVSGGQEKEEWGVLSDQQGSRT